MAACDGEYCSGRRQETEKLIACRQACNYLRGKILVFHPQYLDDPVSIRRRCFRPGPGRCRRCHAICHSGILLERLSPSGVATRGLASARAAVRPYQVRRAPEVTVQRRSSRSPDLGTFAMGPENLCQATRHWHVAIGVAHYRHASAAHLHKSGAANPALCRRCQGRLR